MGRIRTFYETSFRRLLGRDKTAAAFERAGEFASEHQISPALAVSIIRADLRWRTGETKHFPQKFFCDAGLGGLERWLRGAGFEPDWYAVPGVDAATRQTEQLAAAIVTTGTLVLADGGVPGE